jgi:glycerophosphoryl diester phosphodiesterase
MDYLVELARHPDLLEAIKLKSLDSSDPAVSLRRVAFLATEYPNVWFVEVVHQFYAHPEFASQVWVNLRYCATFRRQLAEGDVKKDLKDLSAWKRWQQSSEERVAAISRKTAEFSSDPDRVKKLCVEHKKYPEPPTFLNDLIAKEKLPPDERDTRIRTLLAEPKTVRDAAAKQKIAVPFMIVQEGELDQIRGNRASEGKPTKSDSDTLQRHSARVALDRDLFGLAFSGGGIRSATFNLGVLQALSQIGLLKHVDYLSTVSGGGYIGTWLAGWIRRELDAEQKRIETKELELGSARIGPDVMAEIQRRLSPARSPNPMDEHVRPIRFLREYSNYLTPKTGFLSSDTWTMIGIYLRNTLLNQVIIVSLFAAALLIPRNWFKLSDFLSHSRAPVFVAGALWVLGAVALIINLKRLDPRGGDSIAGGESVKTPGSEQSPPKYARPWVIHVLVVLPWLLACALIARPLGEWALWNGGPFGQTGDPAAVTGSNIQAAAIRLGALIAVSFFAILSLGRTDKCWTEVHKGAKRWLEAFLAIVGSSIVAGAVGAGLSWVLLRFVLLRDQGGVAELRWHLNGIVIPGLMSVLSLGIVALLGMLGKQFPDEHREWWSRLRTVIHIYAVAWLAWFVVAVYVPWCMHTNANNIGLKSGLTALAAWLGSTLLGVKLGPKAEGKRKQESESVAAPSLSATMIRYAVSVAPYVFVVGLVVGISLGIDALYRHNAPPDVRGAHWNLATWTTRTCLLWTLACVAIGVLFSWRVDINEFSIHHFYKNRLVRCYLGASHINRKADWFTGFDPNDDLPLRRFDHVENEKEHKPKYAGPYPIINCALNLVAGQDLAWQERKATAFVFTPKYCGYDVDRAVLTKRRQRSSDGYVPTKAFYHDDEGPLFGMAMAISGAAANPNMGRASSPALSFLMTVFNVRLGWWIGNPRHRAGASMPGPRFGLTYTALELFGGTDDNRKYVNLSDGGHFDNLGVYELIRRNCRYIMVCDAGQDPKFICEDLGDLVRRCRTDFGVEIDIAVDRIRQLSTAGFSQTHCVVGVIHYLHLPRREGDRLVAEDGGPLLPGCRPAHEKGYLIYIKPSITGDEPQDVREYQRRIPEFPHQSTADQWFGESQFESYRKLGVHIAQDTFARYQDADTRPIGSVQQLFERLYHYWYPPSVVIGQRSSELADEYSRIMEMVRTTPGLQGLDNTLFEGLPAKGDKLKPRDAFYICNALIQLIENVYTDLDLEHNWNHPHVEGWMKIFRRWARQPEFRRTWKISEATYAERFRNFYNDRLHGRGLGLPLSFVASHRGRVKKALGKAGNTLEDFDAAIDAGASMIELDVRKLVDGKLIVCHDDKIGGKEVAKTTLDDLESLSVPVLTLDRCLEHLQGKIRLDLELKVRGIEGDVIGALKNRDWRLNDIVLTSFDKDFVKTARAGSSEVTVGLLVERRDDWDDYLQLLDDFLLENEADFLAPEESFLTQKHLIRAEDKRVPLVPWTVNDEKRLRMFLGHAAVAGVITDNVELALSVKTLL